jgi:hypothetical protein
MRKTGRLAGWVAALSMALGMLALGASADPVGHASGCALLGKESSGCKLDGTAYGDRTSRVLVGFPSKLSPKGGSELSVPATFLCAGAEEATLSVKSTAPARIGGSLSFSGKVKVQGFTASGTTDIKSAKITAKLRITSARKASLSGKAELTLTDGTKCSKQLPKKLERILGG